jgi:predicted enzyme related to lactoylglutathione lyase
MIREVRYAHTNLVARDYESLVRFYQDVFGCTPVPPERDYAGPALEAGTALPGVSLKGIHLRLPGMPDTGPTLEIFEYSELAESECAPANRQGFAHIAFSVASVEDARSEVLANGGSAVGEVTNLTTATGATVRWCYVRDPEGNIVELQSWS